MRAERGNHRCHENSCLSPAIWRLGLELTMPRIAAPLRCESSIAVCEAHVLAGIDHILTDDNRRRLEKALNCEKIGRPEYVVVTKTPVGEPHGVHSQGVT